MIKNIKIKNIATYGASPEVLDNLSKINYIYGSNGTGKTTISRVIANDIDCPDCEVTWQSGLQLDRLVYNLDFIEKNFNQPAELRGIFTLGEEDTKTLEMIRVEKEELGVVNSSITNLKSTLDGEGDDDGKRAELKNLEAEFEEKCWKMKKKHDPKFKDAFTRYRGSKKEFMSKLISESNNNSSDSAPLDELEQKAETVFSRTPEEEQIFSVPGWTALLSHEKNPILNKKVIGKADVNIAEMIQKLGNSDWVKAGRKFYNPDERICPFCQQSTDASLEKSLNDYFDETFEADSAEIEKFRAGYKSDSEYLQRQMQELLDNPSSRLNTERLQADIDFLDSKIQINIQHIEDKWREPSREINLEPLIDILEKIKTTVGEANMAAQEHNEMVSNLHIERKNLTGQVWRYLLDHEIKDDLANYKREKTGLENAISSLKMKIEGKEREKREHEQRIRNLEKDTTSIQPTIDKINGVLKSFGFLDFKLAKSEQGNFYKIQRPDGSDAKRTLSEGERNFLLFLYFYSRIKGSETESDITSYRVVVFDDPVSSLDSESLFIVSTLIRDLFETVRKGVGTVKQVFVLTHNVSFHKEVSFNSRRKADKKLEEETFWIVKKINKESKIEKHQTNPIKSSYELLWAEVRNRTQDSLTIRNTLHRILESYFKILGDTPLDEIYSCFEGKEKLICQALLSWVNSGSHFPDDPLYTPIDDSTVENFLNVFEKIFKKTGHEAHYKMMMREATGAEDSTKLEST